MSEEGCLSAADPCGPGGGAADDDDEGGFCGAVGGLAAVMLLLPSLVVFMRGKVVS